MKKKSQRIQKKIFIVIAISISILFGMLTIQNDAVNETNNTSGTSQSPSNTTNKTSANTSTNNTRNTANTTKTNTTKANTANKTTKSSNANLSNLGIRPYDFTGFKADITSYQAVVPEGTKTIEVYAKAQHAKATVEGTGKKNLQEGKNELEVVVTAEDGTKKTYKITIVYGQEEGQYGNGNGLSQLKIANSTLSPEFQTNVYEYTAKYIGQDTKLNIETTPTSEDYTIEVTGNEDLQEGENIITILVSDKNGDNVATYQITLNKSLVDHEAIAREEAEKKERQIKTIIGVIIAVIILIIVITFIVIRRRRNKNIAEDYSGVSLYGKNNHDSESEKEEEDELPKALKEKQEQKMEEDLPEKEDSNEQEEYEQEIENMPKEELKERFLNNYSNYEEEYGDENEENKRKRKGKRFK